MERIVELLRSKINELKNALSQKKLQHEDFRNNLDNVDSETFKKLFPGNDDLLSDIIFYKNWFSTSAKNESQIVEIINKVDNLIKESEQALEDSIKRYETGLSILGNYSAGKYITTEELSIIDNIIRSEFADTEILEHLIETYLKIAKNNSDIELKKSAISDTLSDDSNITETKNVSFALSSSEEKKIESVKNEVVKEPQESAELKKKKEYIKQIKDFLNNTKYQKANKELFDNASVIMKEALEILANDDSLEIDIVELATLHYDISEWYEEILPICTCLKLLTAYKNEDYDEVKKMLGSYKDAVETIDKKRNETLELFEEEPIAALQEEPIDLDEFLNKNNLSYVSELLKKIEAEFNPDDPALRNVIATYNNLSVEDIKSTLSMIGLTEDEQKVHVIAVLYDELITVLEERTINEEVLAKIKQLTNEIENVISDKRETNKSFYDVDSFENYIIVFDEEEFWKSYNKTSERVDRETLTKALGAVFETLRDTKRSSNLLSHSDKVKWDGGDNSYKIRNFKCPGAGKEIRVTFKCIESPYVAFEQEQKHGVVVLYTVCYGKTDKRKEKAEASLDESVNITNREYSSTYVPIMDLFMTKEGFEKMFHDEKRKSTKMSNDEKVSKQYEYIKQGEKLINEVKSKSKGAL